MLSNGKSVPIEHPIGNQFPQETCRTTDYISQKIQQVLEWNGFKQYVLEWIEMGKNGENMSFWRMITDDGFQWN